MKTVNLMHWRGERDSEVLDPATMVFRAEPAGRKQCSGCAFDRQESIVCRAACARAVAAKLPDCDDGFIYVVPDPRQLDCSQ